MWETFFEQYWKWALIGCGAIVALFIGVPELITLVTRHYKATLSDFSWRHFGPMDIAHWTALHYFVTLVLFGFALWLLVHICFGVWR